MHCIGTINRTVKVWLFWDTGSIHYPSPKFISLGCATGNKPWLGAIETSYIPHNHTLTVYYVRQRANSYVSVSRIL